MSFRYAQKQVDRWTRQFTPQYWPPFQIMNHLASEVGELADEVADRYGHRKRKKGEKSVDLGEQIADTVFPLICLANREGVDLQKSWNQMMQRRLYGRDNKRFKRKSN